MDTVMANKKIKDRGVAAPSIPKAGITRMFNRFYADCMFMNNHIDLDDVI